MIDHINPGDKFTFSGVYERIPNPDWRWWSFWRPKWVASDRLQEFKVAEIIK